MHLPEEAQIVRIYIGESDKSGHQPLYEAIVQLARRRGLAGATVLRGIMGFGAHSRLHTAKVLRLSEDLPIVVELVDRADRLAPFLEEIDGIIAEGLVTLEPVRVMAYRHESNPGAS
ncbi:MAG: DUF190 domain-containing protein [Candidatus Bipolaricaulota bacterium]